MSSESNIQKNTKPLPVAADTTISSDSSSDGLPTNKTPTVMADSEKAAPPAQILVDRSQRRGFLPQLTLVPELQDPRTYSNSTKWLLTSLVAVAGAMSSTGSSIFYRLSPPTYPDFEGIQY